MDELSTHRPDWPLNAVPRSWVEALFSKMGAFYGERFTNMWRGSKIDEVQKAWGVELNRLSKAQLKAGVESLTALPKPPTLPEFLSLCRQARSEQAASEVPRLENSVPAKKTTVDANVSRMKGIMRNVRMDEAHPGWAYQMCLTGKSRSGERLTVDTWAHCREAILSEAGRAYPGSLNAERSVPFRAILKQVIAENVAGVSKFSPFYLTKI